MNKEQIAILGAFNATMQSFVSAWESKETSTTQICVAYGGASAMLILARKTTDIKEQAEHAAMLLNQAAQMLGLPETN